MEIPLLWAGVSFIAQNGDSEGLLTAAAKAGIHLSNILPCPGGFQACCAAWHYRLLAASAKKYRVRLRVTRRIGLYFLLRPFLRRRGLLAGLFFFLPLLFFSQNFIWAVDGSMLTAGQRARAFIFLMDADLVPGSYVTEEKLAAGEYSLLKSGEFSWSSLNFTNGRLVVEAATAKAVPEIATWTLHGIRAKNAGTILSTNLISGTMLVFPGQTVDIGQGLIGTARAERDGALVFQPAAGKVIAQFEWKDQQQIPLSFETREFTGKMVSSYRLHFAGRTFSLPGVLSAQYQDLTSEESVQQTRHLQPEISGLKIPIWVEEITRYSTKFRPQSRAEEEALALSRYYSRQTLYKNYPDAEILARKEDFSVEKERFSYRVCYTVAADICEENIDT